MTRIDEISLLINNNDVVADIGCDQALLGIKLAKRGIKSYGSDISNKIIEKAKEKINSLKLSDYISLYVSDGVENINSDVNTLVLAGMGAYTICDVISKSNRKYQKIITVSNTDYDYLRNNMNKMGYSIKLEKVVYDKGKYYIIIVFEPGNIKYNSKELMIGVNVIKDEIYFKYKEYLIDKLYKIKDKSNNSNDKVNEFIKYLESE